MTVIPLCNTAGVLVSIEPIEAHDSPLLLMLLPRHCGGMAIVAVAA